MAFGVQTFEGPANDAAIESTTSDLVEEPASPDMSTVDAAGIIVKAEVERLEAELCEEEQRLRAAQLRLAAEERADEAARCLAETERQAAAVAAQRLAAENRAHRLAEAAARLDEIERQEREVGDAKLTARGDMTHDDSACSNASSTHEVDNEVCVRALPAASRASDVPMEVTAEAALRVLDEVVAEAEANIAKADEVAKRKALASALARAEAASFTRHSTEQPESDEEEEDENEDDVSGLNSTFEVDTGFDHRVSDAPDSWRQGFVVSARGSRERTGMPAACCSVRSAHFFLFCLFQPQFSDEEGSTANVSIISDS
jgi:hypothetical protein